MEKVELRVKGLGHQERWNKGAQIFQKSRSNLKILGSRSKFHTEDPGILGATIQNSIATVTWRLNLCIPALRYVEKLKIIQSHNEIIIQQTKEKLLFFSVCCLEIEHFSSFF
jgi:hypothetical protein